MLRGGSVFGENYFYRAPAGKWAQETSVGCPQQRYLTGETDKVQGRDRVRIVEGSCGYRVRRVSIREKLVFIEISAEQDEGGGRHVVKRSSDPRVAHPEVIVQVRGLVRVVVIFAPIAPRAFSIRGRFVLSSPSG